MNCNATNVFPTGSCFRKVLFDELAENADYQRLPEDNPGGFAWGNQENGENEGNENRQNAENNQ